MRHPPNLAAHVMTIGVDSMTNMRDAENRKEADGDSGLKPAATFGTREILHSLRSVRDDHLIGWSLCVAEETGGFFGRRGIDVKAGAPLESRDLA